MVFAVNAMWWDPMTIGTSIAALIVLFFGAGAWARCNKSCTTSSNHTCKDGSCSVDTNKKTVWWLTSNIAWGVAGAATWLGNIANKATDTAKQVTWEGLGAVEDIANKVGTSVTWVANNIASTTGKVTDSVAQSAKNFVEKAWDNIDVATGGTFSTVVDKAQEVASNMVDKAADTAENAIDTAGEKTKDIVSWNIQEKEQQ